MQNVLILLKRHPLRSSAPDTIPNDELPWSFCWGANYNTIERLYTKVYQRDHHQEGQQQCPDCPFTSPDGLDPSSDSRDIHPKLLENLLTEQDPICAIPELNYPNPTEGESKRE